MRNFKTWFTSFAIVASIGILGGSSIQETAYNLIQTGGTPVARRSTINFTGAGVTVTDVGGVTTVDVPAGGGTCAALGGNVTGTCAANTVVKVNDVAYPASPSTHQIPLVTAANTVTYKTVTDCNGTLKALNFTQSTDLFSCLTMAAQQHTPFQFVIDGGGSAITTGALSSFPTAAFGCTINRTDISADVSGSITVDIWKKAGAIPTAADKISASAPVTLSSAQLNQNGSISGWGTSVASGDVFGGTVATAATVTRVTVQIWCQ